MMGLLPTTGIFVATAPVDLRKAIDGLAALVRQSLGHDPLSGSLYVFGNKRKDRIKILFWEPGLLVVHAPPGARDLWLAPTRGGVRTL